MKREKRETLCPTVKRVRGEEYSAQRGITLRRGGVCAEGITLRRRGVCPEWLSPKEGYFSAQSVSHLRRGTSLRRGVSHLRYTPGYTSLVASLGVYISLYVSQGVFVGVTLLYVSLCVCNRCTLPYASLCVSRYEGIMLGRGSP